MFENPNYNLIHFILLGLAVGYWLLMKGYLQSIGGRAYAREYDPKVIHAVNRAAWVALLAIFSSGLIWYLKEF